MRSTLTLIAVVLIALSLLALTRYLTYPYHAHVVLTGSMGKQVPTGSLIVTKKRPPNRYQAGDIVLFVAPTHEREYVVHRITEVIHSATHVPELATKGDANASGDPWTISRGAVVGEVVLVIPWLGGALHYLSYPSVFLAVALATFCLLVLPGCLRAYQILQT